MNLERLVRWMDEQDMALHNDHDDHCKHFDFFVNMIMMMMMIEIF